MSKNPSKRGREMVCFQTGGRTLCVPHSTKYISPAKGSHLRDEYGITQLLSGYLRNLWL